MLLAVGLWKGVCGCRRTLHGILRPQRREAPESADHEILEQAVALLAALRLVLAEVGDDGGVLFAAGAAVEGGGELGVGGGGIGSCFSPLEGGGGGADGGELVAGGVADELGRCPRGESHCGGGWCGSMGGSAVQERCGDGDAFAAGRSFERCIDQRGLSEL